MFKKLFSLAFCLFMGMNAASGKVIKNPTYEYRNNGTLKVTRVERTKDATRLTFEAMHKPKNWIRVDTTETIITLPDGSTLKPLKIEGDLSYNEKYVMPESGLTSFTITYPPLPKEVKKIDTGVKTGWAIFGIDLSGKKKQPGEIAKPTPYRPIATIFASDTITLSGQINNYDPRSGIKVMELSLTDVAFGHSTPIAIPVKTDGSFSRRIPLPMAQISLIRILGFQLSAPVYLEPGNDLEVVIDYDKMLELSQLGKPLHESITYGGSLAQVNAEINAAPLKDTFISFTIDPKLPLDSVKQKIMAYHQPSFDALEKYIVEKNVSPKAAGLLRNNFLGHRTLEFFDFADFGNVEGTVPQDYYTDALVGVLKADSTILAADSYFLLNRLGFSHGLPEHRRLLNVNKFRRLIDSFAENGIELNESERENINKIIPQQSSDSIREIFFNEGMMLAWALRSAALRVDKDDFADKEFSEHNFIDPMPESNHEFIKRIAGTEEVPLLWQFTITAKSGRDEALYLMEMKDTLGITHPYLIDRITHAAAPKEGTWKLPQTEAGLLMRNLIAPYEGKYLLVDFWDIFCGPCRQGIEANRPIRDRHRGNPGFGILFLASEKGSPLNRYNEYVEKNLKGDDVKRLNEEQMIMLRELFEFSAIPRYILFNPEGEVVNSNYSTYEFWQLLKEQGIIDEIGDY